MELWIRSQDKERLMKATDIRIGYLKQENVWVIEDCDDLGYYKSKERALEILDEIQHILLGDKTYNYTSLAALSDITNNIIFEMPKE